MAMTQPLALCAYARVMPGGQLINRLRDLGYRVATVADPRALPTEAAQHRPLVVFVDVEAQHTDFCQAMAELRRNPATAHLPVVAITSGDDQDWHEQVRQAGATLVVPDHALIPHLAHFLEQALDVS